MAVNLTVMFEDPFWICLYERENAGKYEVSKIIFGAEPKDYEVYGFLLKNERGLKFSPPIKTKSTERKSINPKRRQRKIKKATAMSASIGTKAQQAMQLEREQNKLAKKSYSKQMREQESKRQFELRQQKKKEKHKGH